MGDSFLSKAFLAFMQRWICGEKIFLVDDHRDLGHWVPLPKSDEI